MNESPCFQNSKKKKKQKKEITEYVEEQKRFSDE